MNIVEVLRALLADWMNQRGYASETRLLAAQHLTK